MPPVIPAAIGAALAGGLSAGIAAGAFFSMSAALITGGLSLALGALQYALTPSTKPPLGADAFAQKASGINRNVKQALVPRRAVYGEMRLGGSFAFIEASDDSKYLHLVIVLADHPVQEIGEVWFNGDAIPPDYLDEAGNVVAGPFAGKARVRKALGQANVADPYLIGETTAGANFIGNEMAYLYVRLEYDRDVYASGIPTITAWVKGKKLYDPRDGGTRFSCNPALIAYDYLRSSRDSFVPGFGVAAADIDTTQASAAANVCDEIVTTTDLNDDIVSASDTTDAVTLVGKNSRLPFMLGDQVVAVGDSLPGGLTNGATYYAVPYQRAGTPRLRLATSLANAYAGVVVNITSTGTGIIRKVAEPRYTGAGTIDTSQEPGAALTDILSAMGGSAVYGGGVWRLKAAAYSAPAVSLDEAHLISGVQIRPKMGLRGRFNMVRGTYISPINDGEATDYPAVENDLYRTSDGGAVLSVDYDLPMTYRPHTAQRLAKIKLERARQEIFIEASFNLHAMQCQPGDTITFSNAQMGWVNKEFEVVQWELRSKEDGGAPFLYVQMSLQETASAVYDWNNGEETYTDPAPNTNLPSVFTVQPPTGLGVAPQEISTSLGDKTYEFILSWTPPPDTFVTQGGWYEIQFKPNASATWLRSFRAEDEDDRISIKQVDPIYAYDARVRAVNNLGVRSSWAGLFGFSVGTPAGASETDDWGTVLEAVDFTADWNALTGTEDWGGVT
jgi:hypothetical protein